MEAERECMERAVVDVVDEVGVRTDKASTRQMSIGCCSGMLTNSSSSSRESREVLWLMAG